MTKADDTRQLSTAQLAAIPLLLAGKSVTDTAAAVGVTRQTVSGWLNADTLFIATLNDERADLWEAGKDRLRSLLPRALDVLETGLDHPDLRIGLAAARDVLRLLNPGDCRPDPAVTEEDVRLDLESKDNGRRRQAFQNQLDAMMPG